MSSFISLRMIDHDVAPIISASVFGLLGLMVHAMWQLIGQGFGQVVHLVRRRPILGWGAGRAA